MIFATDRQSTRFGKTPRFPEGLYDLDNGIYVWMVPNGSWGESNAGLVVGEGESLLVDTLWDVDITGEMLEAMKPITRDAPIRYLVNTHADGDHIWGNELVEDAEIIMTEACDLEAQEMKPAAMTMLVETGRVLGRLGAQKLKKIGDYFYSMGYPYNFKGIELKNATRTFEKEMTLEVGAREVRLMDVGPSHTLGDLMVYVPDARTMFCGDLIFHGSTPVLWAGPVENWIAALEMILDMDVDVVVPGHGPVGDKAAVTRLKDYWEYLQKEMGRRFNDGMSAKDAAYDIALGEDFAAREWSRWDNPERIMTNAHILYKHMHLQGRAKHVNPVEKFLILWKQALLAHEIPGAAPALM
jgi:glyoxylase-like metal-dependent hydrolase (beta-lactamase superfamily II)